MGGTRSADGRLTVSDRPDIGRTGGGGVSSAADNQHDTFLSSAMARWLTIGVSYGHDRDAVEFAMTVSDLDRHGTDGELVVVINRAPGSDPAAVAHQLATVPNVHVLAAPCNLGYFGGAAWALNWYRARSQLPDWIVVCNCDLRFSDASFFTDLLARYQDPHEVPAVVGPFIELVSPRRTSRGKSQNPYMVRRPSRHGLSLLRAIVGSRVCYALYRRISFERAGDLLSWWRLRVGLRRATMNSCDVYALFGACLLFHVSYFKGGGTLDYAPFLFGEELFVAENLRRFGLRARYDPTLHVAHREHSSTGGLSPYRERKFSYEALDFIVETYFRGV